MNAIEQILRPTSSTTAGATTNRSRRAATNNSVDITNGLNKLPVKPANNIVNNLLAGIFGAETPGRPVPDEQTGLAIPVGYITHEVYADGARVYIYRVTQKGRQLLRVTAYRPSPYTQVSKLL